MTLIERLLAHREEHLVTSGDHVYDEVPLCTEAASALTEAEERIQVLCDKVQDGERELATATARIAELEAALKRALPYVEMVVNDEYHDTKDDVGDLRTIRSALAKEPS